MVRKRSTILSNYALWRALRDSLLGGDDQAAYERLSDSRNIEQILSRLRLISEVLGGGIDKLDGFTAESASALDKGICASIANVIRSQTVGIEAHERFARWAGLSRYKRPIEIFTTNYDILIEQGLEQAAVPYFDGFVGNYEGSFRADLVDSTDGTDQHTPPARWIRVWKLHGSISWTQVKRNGGSVIVRTAEVTHSDPAKTLAIYPSLHKYQESRRIPFVVLADRLRRSLAIPETLCIVSGYSFGDEHINELLYDAARFHRASEVLALCYSDIPSDVAERAKGIANLTLLGPAGAVIGAVVADWQEHPEVTPFWKDGGFTLGDFKALSDFLLFDARQRTEPGTSEDMGA